MLICHGDAVFCKAVAHIFVERVVHAPVILVSAPDPQGIVDGAGLVLLEAHKGLRLGEDALIGKDGFHDGGLDLLGGIIVGGGEEHVHPALILAVIVYHRGGGDGGVGDGDGLVVSGGDDGVEKADALYAAALCGKLDIVAHGEGPGHQQGNAGEKVCHDVLYGKAQRKSDHAEKSHQRGGGDAQSVGHDNGGEKPENDFHCGLYKAAQSVVQRF